MKKLCAIVCAILLLAIFSSCSGESVSLQDDSLQDDPVPTESELPDTDNPFLLADFSTANVRSGSGKIIGTYGYIEVEKDQISDFYSSDFSRFMAEFVDARVKNSGCNWVSIIFDDGTGFCFAGSNSVVADYGRLDNEGTIIEVLGACQLSSKTEEFIYTDYSNADYNIREIPNPTLMQQGFVPENSFAPARTEIFSSPASENGLEDSAFYLEGIIVSRFDLANYDTILLSTENGDILISEVLIDFPEFSEGDQITVFFIYTGMSIDYELPCGIYIYHE